MNEEYNEYNAPESDWNDLGELGQNESFEDSQAEMAHDGADEVEDRYLDSSWEDRNEAAEGYGECEG